MIKALLKKAILMALGISPMVSAQHKVTGKVEGFGRLSKDNVLDGAMVFSSLTTASIVQLDLQKLISDPEKLNVSLFTTDVPGNLFIPRQSENYMIPITIHKESFTAIGDTQEANEFYALAFQAPFKQTADLGRAKAPWWQMLKQFNFHRYGLSPLQVAPTKPITIHLNATLQKGAAFDWPRPSPNPKSSTVDMVVNLQETNAGRWVLSQLEILDQQSGHIRSGFQGLALSHMSIFLRVENDNKNEPRSMRGYVRHHNGQERLFFKDIPVGLNNIRRDGNVITWDPIDSEGWVAAFKESNGFIKNAHQNPWHNALSFGFNRISYVPKSLSHWARPKDGRITLEERHDTWVLIFAETEASFPQFPQTEQEYDKFFKSVRALHSEILKK